MNQITYDHEWEDKYKINKLIGVVDEIYTGFEDRYVARVDMPQKTYCLLGWRKCVGMY